MREAIFINFGPELYNIYLYLRFFFGKFLMQCYTSNQLIERQTLSLIDPLTAQTDISCCSKDISIFYNFKRKYVNLS